MACESPRFRTHCGGGVPALSPFLALPRFRPPDPALRTLPPLLRGPRRALSCSPLALRRANGPPSLPAILIRFCPRSVTVLRRLTEVSPCLHAHHVLYVPSVCNRGCRHRLRARAFGRARPMSSSRPFAGALLHIDIDRLFRLIRLWWGCALCFARVLSPPQRRCSVCDMDN